MAERFFLFTHLLRTSGLNLCLTHELYIITSVTFFWQILTESPTCNDFTETFGWPKQGIQNPSYSFPILFLIRFFPNLLLKPCKSIHCSFLKHLCFAASKFQLTPSLWCGIHYLILSSSAEPKYSLHLSWSGMCPRVASVHRNKSLLWNALARTISVIHLWLIISSCLAILYCCIISCTVYNF